MHHAREPCAGASHQLAHHFTSHHFWSHGFPLIGRLSDFFDIVRHGEQETTWSTAFSTRNITFLILDRVF